MEEPISVSEITVWYIINSIYKIIIIPLLFQYGLFIHVCLKIQLCLKVARVVNIKLIFYGLILLWFDNTNKVMQNPIQKFRQSSIVFEKPVFFYQKNWKLWRAPTTSIFFAETYECLQKGVRDFFLFCLDLGSFAKTKKDLVSTHSFFTLLLITQDLNKIKKIRKTLL